MYVIMTYVHFGVIEQQIQVYLLNESQMQIEEVVYSTLDSLEETFCKLSEKYSTKYIKIPNNSGIEQELVEKYGFIIFNEE